MRHRGDVFVNAERKVTKMSNSIVSRVRNNNDDSHALTKNHTSDTIFSSSQKSESNNMSAIIMFYDKNNGAIIVSDSRETTYLKASDNKQKVYQNENIIVGQIGLNYSFVDGKRVDFGQMIASKLLDGGTIDDALNQEIMNKKLIDLIPDDKCINVFYAKKNGEVGVFDIKRNDSLVNLASDEIGIIRNVPSELTPLYMLLLKSFVEDRYCPNLEMNKDRLISIMEILVKIESEKEKCYLGQSTIGGKVQVASIKFEKSN